MGHPYAVITINEDGFVNVYGPYDTRSWAELVYERAMEDDIEQKTMIFIKDLYFYETEGGTVL